LYPGSYYIINLYSWGYYFSGTGWIFQVQALKHLLGGAGTKG
jgi:hypothetical protein